MNIHGNGVLGLNFHYLRPALRANLLDTLIGIQKKAKTVDEKFRLEQAAYSTLSRIPLIKPCIKKYLFSHIRSRVYVINPEKWDMIIMLPLANWQGGVSQDQIWQDSDKKIKS